MQYAGLKSVVACGQTSRSTLGLTGPSRTAARGARLFVAFASGIGQHGEHVMPYKPKSASALYIALAGLPDKMRAEVNRDIRVAPKP